jgi:hypothetical protein
MLVVVIVVVVGLVVRSISSSKNRGRDNCLSSHIIEYLKRAVGRIVVNTAWLWFARSLATSAVKYCRDSIWDWPTDLYKSASVMLYFRRVRCVHSVPTCSLSHNSLLNYSKPGTQINDSFLNPVQISQKHRFSIKKPIHAKDRIWASSERERRITAWTIANFKFKIGSS